MEITASATPAGNSFEGVDGVNFGETGDFFEANLASFGAMCCCFNFAFFLPLGGVAFFVFENLVLTLVGSEIIIVGFDSVAITVAVLDGFNVGRISFPWIMVIKGIE